MLHTLIESLTDRPAFRLEPPARLQRDRGGVGALPLFAPTSLSPAAPDVHCRRLSETRERTPQQPLAIDRPAWPAALGRFGLCARENGASEKVNRVRGATGFGVESRQSQRSLRVATDPEPKFRRVIGEGCRVARDQFFIARGGAGAPQAGFVSLSGCAQDAGQLGGIVGIVGGDRQRPQPSDRGIGLAEGGLGLREMPLGWCIGWHPLGGGSKPASGALGVALVQPHPAALEVELRERKRRDASIARTTLREQRFRGRRFPALSVERRQRANRVEIRPSLGSRSGQRERFIESSGCLEDRGALGVHPEWNPTPSRSASSRSAKPSTKTMKSRRASGPAPAAPGRPLAHRGQAAPPAPQLAPCRQCDLARCPRRASSSTSCTRLATVEAPAWLAMPDHRFVR